MKQIVINNKQRNILATVKNVREVIQKYSDLEFINDWSQDKILEFSSEIVWKFLKPRWFGLKP